MLLQKGPLGKTTIILTTFMMVIFLAAVTVAAAPKSMRPAAKDKCPVCGMFVAKFPDFAAQIEFRDGTRVFFDGVKDLSKYYRNLSRYAPGRKKTDIAAVYVTDYYSLVYVDGYTAFYVSGSDVYGPMGKELVPFEKKSDAQEFLKDHKGSALLTFGEINDLVMKSLE